LKTYKLYIAGKFTHSPSGKTFPNINPATEQPLAYFQSATAADVELAVRAAEAAFPSWRDIPAPARGQILLETAHLLKKNKEKLAKLETQEMGKVLKEARGDVQEAIDIFEYMAGEGRRMLGHTTPSELKNKFACSIRIPLGVVGIITPWNFPIAIPAWKISAALICGNTLVFKPSSDTPACAYALVEILEKAGLPKGVINLVTGPGNETGAAIISHPRIRGISFTGSIETGLWIQQNAGLKKIGLELGGKNPIIVMEDANLDLAVDGILWGAFGTTGQRCTAASRIIVHKKVAPALTRKLLARIKKLRVGPGSNPGTDIGPLINKAAQEKSAKYTEIGKKEGAHLAIGGKIPLKKGFFFSPTLFTKVKPNMRIAQEEIFGPITCIIEISNLQEAIEVANSTRYGLSSSIYTQSIKSAFEAIQKIEAGITYINSSTIGAEVHLPFGGVKATGHGREAGIEGINEFTEIKAVYIDYSNKLQKAQGID